MAMVLGVGIIALPAVSAIWLHKNHSNIMSRSYKNQFEYMYAGIHNHRSRWSKYYWPISLLRRIIFIAIPTFFHEYPFMQLMALIFFCSVYLITYAGIRPHWDKRRTRLEIYNEVMIMFFNYHMVIFSDFCTNPNFQFALGTSYCVHIGLVVAVNIGFMLRNTIDRSKRRSRLDKLRQA